MNHKSSTINVTLSVKDSLPGQGNTGGGHYSYTFDPDRVHVTEKDTKIVYRLADGDSPRFRIVNLYTTDAKKQLKHMKILNDGAELAVIHRNKHKQLIVVLVAVHDTQHDRPLNCDPQVTNDPAPLMRN